MFGFFTDVKNALFPLSGTYTLCGDAVSTKGTDNDRLTLSVVGKDGEVTLIANVDAS